MTEAAFLVNGRPADMLPVQDRAAQYGDGVFETVAVAEGIPLCWERHIKRLSMGCERLGFPPPAQDLLGDETADIVPAGGNGVLKILVSRGSSLRGYTPPPDPHLTRIVGWFPGPLHESEHRRDGIDTRICEMRLGHNPRLASIKHLNRLEQVLARAELAQSGTPEAIMLDMEGNVVSGTMSNLFLIRNDTLITADVDRCGVAGIVREILLEQAGRWGLKPEVRKVDGDDVQSADELFFTNSVIGIWPARRLGDHSFPGIDHARRILADLISGDQVRSH